MMLNFKLCFIILTLCRDIQSGLVCNELVTVQCTNTRCQRDCRNSYDEAHCSSLNRQSPLNFGRQIGGDELFSQNNGAWGLKAYTDRATSRIPVTRFECYERSLVHGVQTFSRLPCDFRNQALQELKQSFDAKQLSDMGYRDILNSNQNVESSSKTTISSKEKQRIPSTKRDKSEEHEQDNNILVSTDKNFSLVDESSKEYESIKGPKVEGKSENAAMLAKTGHVSKLIATRQLVYVIQDNAEFSRLLSVLPESITEDAEFKVLVRNYESAIYIEKADGHCHRLRDSRNVRVELDGKIRDSTNVILTKSCLAKNAIIDYLESKKSQKSLDAIPVSNQDGQSKSIPIHVETSVIDTNSITTDDDKMSHSDMSDDKLYKEEVAHTEKHSNDANEQNETETTVNLNVDETQTDIDEEFEIFKECTESNLCLQVFQRESKAGITFSVDWYITGRRLNSKEIKERVNYDASNVDFLELKKNFEKATGYFINGIVVTADETTLLSSNSKMDDDESDFFDICEEFKGKTQCFEVRQLKWMTCYNKEGEVKTFFKCNFEKTPFSGFKVAFEDYLKAEAIKRARVVNRKSKLIGIEEEKQRI